MIGDLEPGADPNLGSPGRSFYDLFVVHRPVRPAEDMRVCRDVDDDGPLLPLQRTSRQSWIGLPGVPALPCSMTFASASVMHRSRRDRGSSGTPRSFPAFTRPVEACVASPDSSEKSTTG